MGSFKTDILKFKTKSTSSAEVTATAVPRD